MGLWYFLRLLDKVIFVTYSRRSIKLDSNEVMQATEKLGIQQQDHQLSRL